MIETEPCGSVGAALVATAATFELASFTYSAGEGLLPLTFDEAVQSRTLNAAVVLIPVATAEAPPYGGSGCGARTRPGPVPVYDALQHDRLTLVMRDDDLLEVQALSDLIVAEVGLARRGGRLARAVSDNDRSAAI